MLTTASEAISDVLRARWGNEGHDVVMCNDDGGGPCRGVHAAQECPLSSHVDLAVLVSTSSSPSTLNEMGFVCAHRHRVPSVAIDPVLAADELWHIAAETSPARRRLEAEDAAAVQAQLPPESSAAVQRSAGRVSLTIDHRSHELAPRDAMVIADAARQVMRARDPYVTVIDVSVKCCECSEEAP